MGFSTLALLIGLNTVYADVCPNTHNRTHFRHHRPQARPSVHWVWVPRQRVRHNDHWHIVPGHWEYHPPLNQRRKNGSK